MQGILKIKRRGQAAEQLGVFPSARLAMTTADRYAEDNFEGSLGIMRTGAPWKKNKPSQKQLAAAKRAGIIVREDMNSGDVSMLLSQRYAGKR